jgi:hypothetical protein
MHHGMLALAFALQSLGHAEQAAAEQESALVGRRCALRCGQSDYMTSKYRLCDGSRRLPLFERPLHRALRPSSERHAVPRVLFSGLFCEP